MNKTITTILPALLMLGLAAAVTQIDLTVWSPSGYTSFTETSTVMGNYWNWPANPVPQTPTATITEQIRNTGSLWIDKQVYTFGTGQQWMPPSGANVENDWTMAENKYVEATGETYKSKSVDVWTCHPDWWTEYYVYEKDVTLTANNEFTSTGEVHGGTYAFDKQLYTDEPLKEWETVFINPSKFPMP